MLYGYSFLSEFPSGAVNHSQSLSAAQGEAVAAGVRHGPNLLAVGAANAQAVAETKLRSKFAGASSTAAYALVTHAAHFYTKILGIGAAETVTSAVSHVHPVIGSVSAAEAIALVIAKPYHIIAPTAQAMISALLKITQPAGYNVTSAQAVIINRQMGKSWSASDSQSASFSKGVGIVRGVGSPESAATVRLVHKILFGLSPALVAVVHHLGKGLGIGSGEAPFLNTGRPYHLGVASAESVSLPFGTRVFQRVFGSASTEAAAAIKGVATQKALTSPEAALLVRTPGKRVSASSAEAAALTKGAGKLLSAADANVANSSRQAGLARGVAASSVAALVTGALHHLAALQAASVNMAALIRTRGKSQAASAASPNVAAASEHHIKILPENLTLSQGQSVGSARGIAHITAAVNAAAQALIKVPARSLYTWSAMVVTAVATAARPFSGNVASTQVVSERGSHVRTPSVSSAQAVATQQSRGHIAGTVSSAVQALQRITSKRLGIAVLQAWAIGKGTDKQIGVASPESLSASAPFGVSVSTAQSQSSSTGTWYHLYVPAWVQQQTTLLPPLGGRAEPPYFGAIDPFDTTTFCFDWSARADANDPIIQANVTEATGALSIGPTFINGTLVEVSVSANDPFSYAPLPITYNLRCTATFASGRRSSYSIPVPMRNL